MTIDRITLRHVRVPLVEPFRISNGVVREKDGIIVSVSSDGITGHGEASPMAGSFYSEETPETTWDFLTSTLVPPLLTEGVDSVEDVNRVLSAVNQNSFARAGLETAFWDLEAQRKGIPLCVLLGGKGTEVSSGLAVGIYPTVQELLDVIERHMTSGYSRVKIKIQPGWDVEPLKEIRRVFGGIDLMV
ncbi:MAG: o-succinylbenzoate synthase, partial [Bacteroidetes bacterium]|nr:o-succinylbenzoate synthase [Bacteroidota bacterium]